MGWQVLDIVKAMKQMKTEFVYVSVQPVTLPVLLRTLSHWTAQPHSSIDMYSLSELCIINLFAEGET